MNPYNNQGGVTPIPSQDKMLVMPKVCNQCLLSANKIVDDDRRDDILESCNKSGQAFECHKSTLVGQRRVCRSFFNQNLSLVVMLAKMHGWYEEKGLDDLSAHEQDTEESE